MKHLSSAGLLPLYLKLYDDAVPAMRPRLESWVEGIADGLAREGISLVRAGFCRLEAECREAIRLFEAEDVDAIVTVHPAYSPSLEAAGALASLRRPVVLIDSTPSAGFGPDSEPEEILFNHGIHGVQDLACMLRRCGVPYRVVAGHASHGAVLPRAAGLVRAARAARVLREARVLRIGEPFGGMGDFSVPDEVLQDTLGLRVQAISPGALAPAVTAVRQEDIDNEVRRDRELYDVRTSPEVHRSSVRVGLGLRQMLEKASCDALSLNFLAFDGQPPVDVVPFLEASKAMARGMGYAGEGDVLTAGLVRALAGGFGRATFTEMFCPDWEGGTLFLSHMGEINPGVSAERPTLVEREFPWSAARKPAILACAPSPGPAVLVNIAPGPDDRLALLAAPVEVLEDSRVPAMREGVRGWIRPLRRPLPPFLEEYSRLGGTHHCALLMGEHTEAVLAFAAFSGLEATAL